MSKVTEEFFIQLTVDETKIACKNAIAQLGWRIMEEDENKIVCKEVSVQATSFNWPAEVAISLFEDNDKTKIILNGSIMGFGPIQGNHLKGQVGRIRNLIETTVFQLTKQNSTPIKSDSLSSELEKLADLHSKGILNEEEFKNAKNKLLNI